MERFVGKVAVVTGAGSGIGLAIAKLLVKCGLIVVGLDKKEIKSQEVFEECQQQFNGEKIMHKKCDVTEKDDVIRTFKSINDDVGRIWILVNCAGVLIPTTLLDADDTEIDETFGVNVKGLLLCAKEAMNSMSENSVEGHIVNINSINGHYIRNRSDISQTMIYAASKHAVTVLTEGLRREMIKRNLKIKCSSISPGNAETALTASERLLSKPDASKILQPEDVAKACLSILNTPPDVLISELMIMGIFQEI